MKRVTALKFLICFLFITGTALSRADVAKPKTLVHPEPVTNADEYRFSFGFLGGVNIPEGSKSSTPEIGMDFGFQPYIPYSAGVELTTSNFGSKGVQKRTTFLLKSSYNFGGDIPVIKYSYVGLGIGPTFLYSGTELAVAPMMGFDIPLQGETHHQEWSLGFYAKYLMVTTNDPDSLIMLGSLKYWF